MVQIGSNYDTTNGIKKIFKFQYGSARVKQLEDIPFMIRIHIVNLSFIFQYDMNSHICSFYEMNTKLQQYKLLFKITSKDVFSHFRPQKSST